MPRYFTSDATFIFLSGSHALNSPSVPVVISNITNITLTASDEYTTASTIPTIHCSNRSFGLIFDIISQVTISRLAISGCGRSINDSGLVIRNATKVILEHFAVHKALGIGVMIKDVHDISVVDSTFSYNGIGVKRCSPKTYQWWYSISITAINIDQVSYAIVNTTFDGNSPTKQLGGGLHINIINTNSVNVTIDYCQFRKVFGCLSAGANITINGYKHQGRVLVANSLFSDNIRMDIENYETHTELDGGALKIKAVQNFDSHNQSGQAILLISVLHSAFLRNRANYCGGAGILTETITSQAVIVVRNSNFSSNTGIQRSGGMCLVPISDPTSNHQHFTMEISNCTFDHNVAPDGAALLIWSYWSGNTTNRIEISNSSFKANNNSKRSILDHRNGIITIRWTYDSTTRKKMVIIIHNCSFVENVLGSSLYMTYTGTYFANSHYMVNITVRKCIFNKNYATAPVYGSGICAGSMNGPYFLKIHECVFSNSFGYALAVWRRNDLLQASSSLSVSIVNVTVTSISMPQQKMNSEVVYSIIGIFCKFGLQIVSISDIHFYNNQGSTVMSVLNSALKFSGYNVISNNTALSSNGGGLSIEGTGYMFGGSNVTLIFSNNRAKLGGAIYSTHRDISNSFCTITNIHPRFVNNSAYIAGNDIYGGTFTNCVNAVGRKQILPTLNKCKVIQDFFGIIGTASSDPYSIYMCKGHIRTNNVTTSISIFPGQTMPLKLSTTGYCNNFSPGYLDITTSEGLHIETNLQSQQIDAPCKEVSFKPSLVSHNISKGIMYINIANPTFRLNRQLTVNITLLPCPHGMDIGHTGICECDKITANLVHRCNISWIPNPFMKLGRNDWLAYDNHRNCTITARTCPLDYCSVDSRMLFNLDNHSDYQCSNNRTGTLCGHCQTGLSLMLGSNACSHCTNTYLLLVPAFIIAGILLIFFMIILNMTVSVGSINGLLFYANIVKLNESVLFPDGSIPAVSQFISWINFDFGIQSCLFDGLDGYWKTWLQFVFPLYLWLLTAVIILCSKHSIRFSHQLRSNIISVLATLVLMSFTKILRNVMAIFMATKLDCGQHVKLVWSIDGNIDYLSVKHSILVIASALALLFVVLYTIVILPTFSKWMQCMKNYRVSQFLFRLHPFIDAYAGAYTVKYRYWTGVLLVVRIVITVTFAFTSGSIVYINNYIIIFIEGTIIWNILHSSFYRLQFSYFCEKFFHFNLCALCLLNSVLTQSSYKQYTFIGTTVSVAASFIMFVIIVLQQLYKQYLAGKLTNSKKAERQMLLHKGRDSDSDSCCYSPARVVNKRDSIIFHYD